MLKHVCGLALGCLTVVWAEPGWHQVPFGYQLGTVAVQGDSEAWAAGTAGSYLSGFFHWDGLTWTLGDTFRSQLVYDICYADSRVWAVGEQFNFPDGIVWHWDGRHWQHQVEPFDRALQAVAFSDSAHGYAAGAAPVTQHPVMRYSDGVWQLDTALTTRRIILGLASPWSGKCYAVGDSGSIFRYDYGAWTRVPSPTTNILRRVALESNTEGWAVGNRGTILRCFKDMWSQVPSPTTRNLRGLAIAGTSDEAWAVGDSGTILHCVRDSWHLEPFVPDPADAHLYTVSFNSGTHGWAFGYKTMGAAVALRYYDPAAIEGEEQPAASRRRPMATAARGHLHLPAVSGERSAVGVSLLDASGRTVLNLHPGLNDVSRLAPGVYFIRGQGSGAWGQESGSRVPSPESRTVQKVILTR